MTRMVRQVIRNLFLMAKGKEEVTLERVGFQKVLHGIKASNIRVKGEGEWAFEPNQLFKKNFFPFHIPNYSKFTLNFLKI